MKKESKWKPIIWLTVLFIFTGLGSILIYDAILAKLVGEGIIGAVIATFAFVLYLDGIKAALAEEGK